MAESEASVDNRPESTTGESLWPAVQRPSEAPGRASEPSSRASRRRPRVSMQQVANAVAFARTKVANTIWLAAALCAAVLAIGALLVAFEANAGNPVVVWFTDGATWLAGPLSTVFEFQQDDGSPDKAKNALVNWGIAALAFLVVGRLVQRLVRP